MSKPIHAPQVAERVRELLVEFKLTTAAEEFVARMVEADFGGALPIVAAVLEREREVRHQRRVDRLRRASKLPNGKTFATFDDQRLNRAVVRKLDELRGGEFIDNAVNVLAFGLPGVGKSHAIAALGHALVEQGRSVLFTPTYTLVQDLLAAKRDLDLPRKLRKLDNFELIVLDDIGYVKQSADEAEVIFTLLAERYERRSTAITSNLVFSEWDRIFKNKMATSAAIDRLVHHSVVLEFDVSSYRAQTAKTQPAPTKKPPKKPTKPKQTNPIELGRSDAVARLRRDVEHRAGTPALCFSVDRPARNHTMLPFHGMRPAWSNTNPQQAGGRLAR